MALTRASKAGTAHGGVTDHHPHQVSRAYVVVFALPEGAAAGDAEAAEDQCGRAEAGDA